MSGGFAVFWERFHPWIGAVVAVAVWWYAEMAFPVNPDSLFGTAATVASVFASFLGVAKGLILTIKSTETYKVLERNGYLAPFYEYLGVAIWAAIAFAVVSVIGFFVYAGGADTEAAENMRKLYKLAWVFCAALALLSYVRFGRILFRLLKHA
ncbi:hypothetical protein [Azospirillum argentinense]|uniref:Uncharacterized protein n=1 Tax=Azospirillum brasilense TaxID=192 RepID=A0A4D8Q825_AZOBR|nr:hypothetical protein [Azospirillum argentinense]QCO05443.1 hypothetical protein D3867_26215 [Azospirillum argentinense]